MEQTTRYGSSAWRRNRFLVLLLLVFGLSNAQSAGADMSKRTLAARYPMQMLEAHQANSIQKLTDLYHYLNLLSAAGDDDLKSQLKENIFALFTDRNILVGNLLTTKADRIPLSYLLDSIASKNITFNIKDEQVGREFYFDFWIDYYTIEIVENGQSTSREIKQPVYLKPENKAFGQLSKTVLTETLGAFE